MKSINSIGKKVARNLLGSFALAGYLSIASLSVHAATSFPQYPLQTGAGAVSPNIMFILDDSGSMAYRTMPYDMYTRTNNDLLDTPFERSVPNNSIFYSPAKTYTTWINWDGTSMTGGDSPAAVYADPVLVGGTTTSIVDRTASFFYVPKTTATDLTDATQYERYRITSAAGSAVVKDSAYPSTTPYDYQNVSGNGWSTSINTKESKLAVFTSGGTGNLAIWVTDASGKITGYSDANQIATEHANTESVVLDLPFNGISNNYTVTLTGTFSGARVQVLAWTPSESAAVPTGSIRTSAADEAKNFAIWYSYYSTRSKIAKGGASKAFSGLGSGYRVGFDQINSGSIMMPVPTNASEFSGTNRSSWFNYLFQAPANGGTPLRSALARTGEYYKTAAAWTDSGASTSASCRSAYAVLSTDGYWNLDSNFSIGGGADQDGDGYANTLADVAAYYYKNDLMPSLADNVPTTQYDTNKQQHMVTFGISLGATQSANATPPSSWSNPVQPDNTPGIDAIRMADLWHAAINSKGRYIGAADSDAYAQALKDAFNQIENSKASGSNITANGNSLNNGAQLFQAMYNTPIWTGDILAFDITTAGVAGRSNYDWSLAKQASTDAAFTSRPVFFGTSSGAKAFSMTNQSLLPSGFVSQTGAQTTKTGVTLAQNVAYILGDASLEKRNGGKLRNRTELLPDPLTGNNITVGDPIGDIVNSSPFYVRQLNALFIGANDGMLHGIDSVTGKTLFSYMPIGIDYASLANLSDPQYTHHFFVDGQVDVSNQDQGGGGNILVASLGRGGRGIFGLNVTSVNTHDATTGAFTGTFDATNVLFDNTGAVDANMGYVLAQPQVRMSNSGSPIIITGNGVDSANGHAVLYIYNTNGTVLRTFDTGVGSPTSPNGLMQTSVADTNGDGVIDVIYAGDLQGNVWQIDVSSSTPASWDFALRNNGGAKSPLPLFTALDSSGVAQPITGGITATKDIQSGNIFLVFGTGRLVGDGTTGGTNDLVTSATQQTQTIYGLSEAPGSSPTAISGRSALTQHQFAYTGVDSSGRRARSLDAYSPLPSGSRGWYVDLASNSNTLDRGERVVTSPVVNGAAAWISSLIPQLGSGCANTGRGYLNAIDVFTGTNPATGSFFYFSGSAGDNGKISVGGATPSGNDGYKSSVDLGVAMPSAPAIVDSKVVVNGSNANIASADIASGVPASFRMMWREVVNQN